MLINPKIVSKPWGQEVWLSDGIRMPYALKRITFNQGHRSSLQVHWHKQETNHVVSGTGILFLGTKEFPLDDYLDGKMTKDEIDAHVTSMEVIELKPGMTIDVRPWTLHRVVAVTDLVFFEASTAELDDVIRLDDDSNRGHGRIQAEHD